MKWLKKGWIICAMVGVMVFLQPETASAKALQEKKSYQLDLNGDGKKESIKWYSEEVEGTYGVYRVRVYIDGKQVLKKTQEDSICVDVSVVDVKNNDGKKELYVHFMSESECFSAGYAYRYEKGALKLYFELEPEQAPVRLHIQEKQPGNGKVAFASEFSDYYAHMGYVTQQYEIKNGKLKLINKKTLNTTSEWRKMEYKTMMSLKAYKNVGDKTAAFTLPKGTEFKLQKIYVKDTQYLGPVTYIYVKTKDGKTGWIKNPNRSFLLGRTSWDNTWNEYVYVWG